MTDSLEFVRCDNCKRDILSSNFIVHEIHCQRYIYLCSKCNEPVNHKQRAEHEKANHKLIFCSNCHVQIENFKLNDHLIKDCPSRKVKCQICDIEVGACDISEHENYCGARTEKCLECGEFVMLKYKQLHIDSNHTFIKLSDEPGPSPSWQNGTRTLGSFFPDLQSRNHTTQFSQNKKLMKNENSKLHEKEMPDILAAEDKSLKGLLDQNETKKLNSFQETTVGNSSTKQNFERLDSAETAKCNSNICLKPDSASNAARKYSLENQEIIEDEYPYLMNIKSRQTFMTGNDSSTKCSKYFNNKPKPSENENIQCRQTIHPSNKINFTEGASDFAPELQVPNKINNVNDIGLKNKEVIAQAIEENAAGISEFSFFDSIEKSKITSGISLPKNIFKEKKSNKAMSKSQLRYHADDSSDEEFHLYSKRRDKDEDAKLPCQFCGSLYSSSKLMSHQKECIFYRRLGFLEMEKNIRSLYHSEKPDVLCELCLRVIPFNLYNSHQIKFHPNSFEKRNE